MSWWSITAMSPGRSRLVRSLVRASTRTVPWTPGRSGSRRCRRRERDIADHRAMSRAPPSCTTRSAPGHRGHSVHVPRGAPAGAARGRARPRCRSRESPAIIRASSRSRSSPVTAATPEAVTWPSSVLRTTRCWSANAATWARCVTTITWAPPARAARRAPTSRAALPPTPASTSSKTNVGTSPLPVTTSRASMTRESSPPEAALATLRAGAPGLAASTISTSSTPWRVNRTGSSVPGSTRPSGSGRRASTACTTALPMARWASSVVTRFPKVTAAACRAALRVAAASASWPRRTCNRAASSWARSSAPSSSSSRAADSLAQASTSSMLSPYLRCRRASSARRCCTHASRAGSTSTPARYAARSPPRSAAR